MLPNALNTNEVKNAAGTEVEFQRLISNDRTLTFAQVGELPNLEHRLKVSHQEAGTGSEMRRRSVTRVDKKVTGVSGKPRNIGGYIVLDVPVGDIADYTEAKNVLSEVMSFAASTGADTAIKFDCTGNGAAALISGSL